ncbi:hypothetical protein [Stenotrophomonas maltophilia]|uniref:hypothetical protein n=2 Tax=Stenotrophomonas maltophilia TaxID=40324 RepID=UPI001E3F647F|nr:hypothetical protein [Stenotrophomonas maltophilia]MCI1058405.1 hypothetical protein [Stenotrophomonas maltophilia]MCI1062427.1 hypothetical protein [Stenotrophomonas maltophilia]MCI1079515.1 hypothetical protein [Stenotrophomonas maltophilia]MCI1083243.1 hypothetical protein [Stenotrophomonas maltophilia]MCI1093698.1 hypothetical protein [Stenotrophomonas maltophilia]
MNLREAAMTSSHIYFAARGISASLNWAAEVLADYGLELELELGGNSVLITGDEDVRLRLSLNDAPHVLQEAIELAHGTGHVHAMSQCTARFEISITDLEAVLDEMNTLIEVQQTLLTAVDGVLWNEWNEALSR